MKRASEGKVASGDGLNLDACLARRDYDVAIEADRHNTTGLMHTVHCKHSKASLLIGASIGPTCNRSDISREQCGETALESADKALIIKPDHADGHLCKATALQLLGKHGEALYACRKAMSFQPQDENARKELCESFKEAGNFFYRSAQYEIALKVYTHGIQMSDGSTSSTAAKLLYNRANTLTALKRYDEALEDATVLVAFDSPWAQGTGYQQRGNALTQLKRWEEARAAYERALEFDSVEGDTRAKIVATLAALDQQCGGKRHLEHATDTVTDRKRPRVPPTPAGRGPAASSGSGAESPA